MSLTYAEYIWIDGTTPTQKLRSKTKTLRDAFKDHHDFEEADLAVFPEWGFDGSSTNQAEGNSSDCILKPARVVIDPTRADGHLVLCEVFSSDNTPHSTNTRAKLRKLMDAFHNNGVYPKAAFGFEQEYTFMKSGRPLGWPESGYPAPQGPFYCGVGADEVFGREIVEEHMKACGSVGIDISGVNAEVMPGQWEFQIGGPNSCEFRASDDLWLARWLLYRIAEGHKVSATLHPKPVRGDWNGSGMHTNFSTAEMRVPGGLSVIKEACDKFGTPERMAAHLNVYGIGYKERLTGEHETCSYKEFRWGIGDRTASIRIPLSVSQQDCGYLEDRRPCANADPYEVARVIMETALL